MCSLHSRSKVFSHAQPYNQRRSSSSTRCLVAKHALQHTSCMHSTFWSSQILKLHYYSSRKRIDAVPIATSALQSWQHHSCKRCTAVPAAGSDNSGKTAPGGGISSSAAANTPSNSSSSTTGSSSSNSSTGSSTESSTEAWALMGRVVSSDRLVVGQSSRQRLVLIAAAKQAGITPEDMAERLKELVLLLPDLSSLLPSLHPKTLAVLGADTQGVAQKLIKLRLLFPSADVSQMISRRPTLLLDEEFQQVEEAREKLMARMAPGPGSPAAAAQPNALGTTGSSSSSSSSCMKSAPGSSALGRGGGAGTTAVLDGLVSRQPLLLVKNVDNLLDELERLLPAVDVVSALLRDPDIVMQVMCNRHLSLW